MKLCKCGCGLNISTSQSFIYGHRKWGVNERCWCGCGKYKDYHKRGEIGFCNCGCGNRVTKIGNLFIKGHSARISNKGRHPWNKGLTKKDDERILIYSNKNRNKTITKEHLDKMLNGLLNKAQNGGLKAWNKGNKERIQKICIICDKVYYVIKSHSDQKMCSKICANKYLSNFWKGKLTGEDNPNYGNGAKVSQRWKEGKYDDRVKNQPMFTRGKGGYYEKKDGSKQWMRSSWELKYAAFLDKKNIKWEYEPFFLKLENSRYLPDFIIVDKNEIHEVKGNTKLTKKFYEAKEKYTEYTFVLIDKEVWKEPKDEIRKYNRKIN